jgi:hypothetical protein
MEGMTGNAGLSVVDCSCRDAGFQRWCYDRDLGTIGRTRLTLSMRCPVDCLSALVLPPLSSACLIYLLIPLKFGGGIVVSN